MGVPTIATGEDGEAVVEGALGFMFEVGKGWLMFLRR